MGVDLRLLPLDCDVPDIRFSYTVLECERRRGLWDKVSALPALEAESGIGCYVSRTNDGECGYGPLPATDAYGKPYKYTTARHLLTLTGEPGVTDSHKNRAIWAYLAELPPDTKVVLDWH